MSTAEEWAWKQTASDGSYLAANLRLALLALARAADKNGFFVLRRKEIGDLLQCSLDTVDRRIKKLEGEGLLNVERVPRKNGYGPSKYTLAMAGSNRKVAATIEDAAGRTIAAQGQRSVAARGNATLRPGESAKVAATDAASIRKPSNTVEEEPQSYPERTEGVFESGGEHELAAPPIMLGGGPFREDWVLGEPERKFAHDQGLRNGSVDVQFAIFGAHHLSKNTITVNWKAEWRKWVLREMHDPRFNTKHEKSDEQCTGASDTADVRRERVSPATAARHRRRAEREAQRDAIDYGRVESERIV